MKNRILRFVTVAAALLLTAAILCGCSFLSDLLPSSDGTYSVTFVYGNGQADKTVSVDAGSTVSTPNDPVKANSVFVGWYLDPLGLLRYDFSQAVNRNLTLYALYETDTAKIVNAVSQNAMRGVLKIYNKCYNKTLGIETSSKTMQGSGFCFLVQNGCYYVLTNCHVVAQDSGYTYRELSVEDCFGNVYSAQLYRNSNKIADAISPDYDLACLYFKPASSNVKALSILADNPSVGENVISLGAPKGQSNFISMGSVDSYKTVQIKDTSAQLSNVHFNVICHDAPIDNGSSGGPLLNTALQVVGVNYASAETTSSEEAISYAIPAEKVNEFLRLYVYN